MDSEANDISFSGTLDALIYHGFKELTVLFPKFFTLQLKYADLPTNAVTYIGREFSEDKFSFKIPDFSFLFVLRRS